MIGSSAAARPLATARQVASTFLVLPTAFSLLSRSYAQKSWADDAGEAEESQKPTKWLGGQQRESWNAPLHKLKGKQRQRKQEPMVRLPLTKEDYDRYQQVRVRRAERLERRDLTAQMTETKTYMGGFTQPRHFQYLNVMDPTRKDKDSYTVRVSDERIRPSAAAYEPHTVYLAVTRYPIRWGHGRATRREVFSDFCKESELAERFKEMNYGTWKEESTALVKLQHGQPKQPVTTPAHWSCHSNSKEYIDLAVFPGSPEERTLLNKPASHRVRAILKEIGRLEQQAAAETASTSTPSDSSATPSSSPAPPRLPPHLASRKRELQQQLAEMKCELLPPVPKDFTRPPPPYLSPPLVVPFLTVTFPTRPLAATVARLCNAHPRGLPFIASIPDDDRKDGPALFRRLLRMRTDRLQTLTQELVQKISGHGGGLMGLRLKPEDRGRGIQGEGLREEIAAPTERGWAEYSWLDEESACWEGIAKEVYLEKWDGMEDAKRGPNRLDDGKWKEEHPLVEAGEDGAELQSTPVQVPVVEVEDDVAVETERSL